MFFFTDSHENFHAVGTRFHYFPVIVGQPNLVSSFLTIFPRVVFRNITEKSNPPLRKNCWNSAILTFIWSALGTRYPYFPVIIGEPHLVSRFLKSFPRVVFWNIPEKSNTPLRKNCWNSTILTFIWSALGTYKKFLLSCHHRSTKFDVTLPDIIPYASFLEYSTKVQSPLRKNCWNSAILTSIWFALHWA